MTLELDAFRSVKFDWTRQLRSIWRDPPYHIPSIQESIVNDLLDYFLSSTRDAEPDLEPLGRVVIGPAGLGKTHLVGELRRQVWESSGTFILLDLVGVKDFWSSVALGFLNSLQVRLPDGRTQYDSLILKLASKLALQTDLTDIATRLRGKPRELMAELVGLFIRTLMRDHREATLSHQDVIRALVMLISDDLECASIAHAWLQGMDLDPAEVRNLGFIALKKPAIEIVRGISWLLSLVAPTLIAVDQIDAIISEANVRARHNSIPSDDDEDSETQSIIEALANGLMELHEVKRRAVTIVSCLEASWQVLTARATTSVEARYRTPTVLRAINQAAAARSLVAARLNQAYSSCNFVPPYESWPFVQKAFDTAIGFSPRQLLRACEDHRLFCLAEDRVVECLSFDASPAPHVKRTPHTAFDEMYGREFKAAQINGLLDLSNEDLLRDLLADILKIYSLHLELPEDIDVVVQIEPDQRRPSLHGRLTFIFRSEGDREQHFCFRVLAHTNAIAFQSRLSAAMTASGVDRALRFRHLFIVRRDAAPGGAKTKQLVARFLQADGRFLSPSEDDLRAFIALRTMWQSNQEEFDEWLRTRKPLFDTSLFKAAGLCLPPFLPSLPPNGDPTTSPRSKSSDGPLSGPKPENGLVRRGTSGSAKPDIESEAALSTKVVSRGIPLGRRFERSTSSDPVRLPADLLPRHLAILAGSGSGKTVLLRRIVEEAALVGIPAIVLDTNNDLARLGDSWPERPDSFSDEDAAKAAEYARSIEVVIWTPGRNGGRPMSLGLLPDFGALGDDDDERNQAIEMARATLAPFIGATGASAKLKEGVLANTLCTFAREGGGSLERLIDLLSDLPEDVSQIGNARKIAAGIADQLRAAIATNPLLQSRGENLDPQSLFGRPTGKARISVINFSGLQSDEARQSFVNQLQMSLFTWIKNNPSPTGRLYVLDEAQNFAPSQKMTPCKESTISLAAQARKYGLGMIFATQTPKGIDNKIVSNCTTHFYGRMSSPTTIEATRELMAAKGGTAEDIGRLKRGEFYFSSEATAHPIKIHTPLCLTWHPANPLTVEQVVAKARGE